MPVTFVRRNINRTFDCRSMAGKHHTWLRPRRDPFYRRLAASPPRRPLFPPADRRTRLHPLRARTPRPLLAAQARRRTKRGAGHLRLRPRRPAQAHQHGVQAKRGSREGGIGGETAQRRRHGLNPNRPITMDGVVMALEAGSIVQEGSL